MNATAPGYVINGDGGGLYKLTIDGTGGVPAYRRGIDGTLTINAPVVLAGYDLDLRSGTKTFNGTISDDGSSRTLTNQAGSTLILNNANTFSWNVSNLGTLVFGHDQALGTATFVWGSNVPIMAANGPRTIANTFSENWNFTYVLGGHDSLTMTTAHSFPTGPWGGKSTFNVVESDAVLTFSSATGNASYAAGFYKTGPGTLAFGSFTNPIKGVIDVQAGILLANGPFDASGMTVSPGATVGGTGTINLAGGGTVSVDGAIAPGASIGTFTITGDTAFNAWSVLRIDLDSDSVGQKIDMLIVNGDLSVDPTATIEFVGDGSVLGLFEFMQHTGSGGMDFLNIDVSQVTGLIAGARLVEVGGSLFLSTVPEPASLGLLALTAGALVVRRRRSGS